MNDAIAYRIANACAALGIPVQITHAWQVGAVACYALAFSPRITVREIKARQDDLARLVGASITISQDETTGMVIAQARAPRRQRLLAGPNAPKLCGLRVAIGRLTNGQGDAVLDFASPRTPTSCSSPPPAGAKPRPSTPSSTRSPAKTRRLRPACC